MVKRSDSLLEDVRLFLLQLLKSEQVYKVKVDCIQKNMGNTSPRIPTVIEKSDVDNILFTFQVNKKVYFTKTLKEVEQFCLEYVNEVKSPLVKGISELFTFRQSESVASLPNFRPSGDNINTSSLDISRHYKSLHMELENTSQQLEGYLRHILNDPDLYSDLVYKFFNCHQIFQMIPYIANFRDQNKQVLS